MSDDEEKGKPGFRRVTADDFRNKPGWEEVKDEQDTQPKFRIDGEHVKGKTKKLVIRKNWFPDGDIEIVITGGIQREEKDDE